MAKAEYDRRNNALGLDQIASLKKLCRPEETGNSKSREVALTIMGNMKDAPLYNKDNTPSLLFVTLLSWGVSSKDGALKEILAIHKRRKEKWIKLGLA